MVFEVADSEFLIVSSEIYGKNEFSLKLKCISVSEN